LMNDSQDNIDEQTHDDIAWDDEIEEAENDIHSKHKRIFNSRIYMKRINHIADKVGIDNINKLKAHIKDFSNTSLIRCMETLNFAPHKLTNRSIRVLHLSDDLQVKIIKAMETRLHLNL
jgi:hypothetical protein